MELKSSDELWAKSMPQRDAMDGSGDERGRERGGRQDETRTKPGRSRPAAGHVAYFQVARASRAESAVNEPGHKNHKLLRSRVQLQKP